MIRFGRDGNMMKRQAAPTTPKPPPTTGGSSANWSDATGHFDQVATRPQFIEPVPGGPFNKPRPTLGMEPFKKPDQPLGNMAMAPMLPGMSAGVDVPQTGGLDPQISQFGARQNPGFPQMAQLFGQRQRPQEYQPGMISPMTVNPR